MHDEIKEKKRRGQLKALLDNMIEGVIILDLHGKITLINSVIENIFGIKEEELLEHPLIEAIRNPELDYFLKETLDKQRMREIELEMVTPVEGIFKIRAAFYEKVEVEKKGLLVIFNDITALRKLERSKAEFVANVSHELRTPLASIKGFVETLQEGALEDKKNSRKFLAIINQNVDRLDALIRDILDLSKIESKKMELKREVFSIKDIIENVLDVLSVAGKKKKIKINVVIAPEAEYMNADKMQLEQVIMNLMDNGIKFNNDGGELLIKVFKEGSQNIVLIKDTGIGIPESDIPRIFERFYRVDKGRSRMLGGTGLGLSIVKHIIENHGGRIKVSSAQGKGTEFVFNIP